MSQRLAVFRGFLASLFVSQTPTDTRLLGELLAREPEAPFTDLLGPRKIPVHGTRGTTGSEGCLLVHSVVGNSLIFPTHSFAFTSRIRSRSAAGGAFILHLQASGGLCRGGRAGACGF